MSNLHARFATLDQLPAPDLWAEVERRAMAGAGTNRVGRIGLSWRGPAPSTATQRLVLALVLLGLLALALLGAAVAGSLIRDPLRGLVAPVEADATATREESGQTTPVTETFTSDVYGYSIRYPRGWDVSPAVETWVGYGSRGPSVTDVFQQRAIPGNRFAVVAGPLAIGLQDAQFTDEWRQGWIDTTVPPPPELRLAGERRSCDLAVVRDGPEVPPNLPETTVVTEDLTIGGLRAQLHAICGHVDAVVWGEGRVFILSLVTPGRVEGDVALLKAIAETFEPGNTTAISGPTPSPSPSATPVPSLNASKDFHSTTYGYTIGYPATWTVRPATSSWDRSGASTDAMTDEFAGPDGRLTHRFSVVAKEVESGWSQNEHAWIDANVPLSDEYVAFAGHGQDTHGHCFFRRGDGTTMLPASTPQWESGTLAGRPGHERAVCGRIDGVVFAGSKAFVLTLFEDTLRMAQVARGVPDTAGDLDLFHLFADTLLVDDALAAPILETGKRFISDLYGYSLRYPAGWTPRMATAPWTGGQGPAPTMVDAMVGPIGGDVTFSVASRGIDPGALDEVWLATFVPLPAQYLVGEDGVPACDVPGRYEPRATNASTSWTETTIGRYPGRVRWTCDRIDGVISAGGRAYVLSYIVEGAYLGNGDPIAFDAFADTFVVGE